MVAELIQNGVRKSNDKTNGFCSHIGTPGKNPELREIIQDNFTQSHKFFICFS
jgi:hypothetical protein